MKTAAAIFILLVASVAARAATTINPGNRHAYGANIGWLDARGDTNNGAVIGEYICSGHIYAANVGWVNLGNGAPTNGIQYQNLGTNDFGVNQDGAGNLRGYAYGANIGWINFENSGAPKVDLATGRMDGYAWSANCGWISLSNTFAFVQTDVVISGSDTNANGLPDAWERQNFGAVGVSPGADADSDGMSNQQEYLAGTSPTNALDKLVITAFAPGAAGGTAPTVTWKSTDTRRYYLQKRLSLSPGSPWLDSGLGLITPDGAATSRMFADTNAPVRFYRVQAVRPLTP